VSSTTHDEQIGEAERYSLGTKRPGVGKTPKKQVNTVWTGRCDFQRNEKKKKRKNHNQDAKPRKRNAQPTKQTSKTEEEQILRKKKAPKKKKNGRNRGK